MAQVTSIDYSQQLQKISDCCFDIWMSAGSYIAQATEEEHSPQQLEMFLETLRPFIEKLEQNAQMLPEKNPSVKEICGIFSKIEDLLVKGKTDKSTLDLISKLYSCAYDLESSV